jgi:hypothetical protein
VAAVYSLLEEGQRKAALAEIPESKLPPPGAMPDIPESGGGVLMELPPDDMPPDVPGLAQPPRAG